MAERNKNNFLRWSNASAETTLLPFTQMAEKKIRCTQPILVPGEVTSFYWNDIANAATSGSINLVKPDNTVVSSGIGSLSQIAIANSGTHAVGTLTCPNVPQGYYKLAIGSSLYSNVVEVVTEADLIAETAYFEFWDTRQVYNFLYPYTPEGFKQRFRLRYDRGPHQYFKDQEKQVYISGEERNISDRGYKYFKMKIKETDESMRDAVELMLSHSNLYVNGFEYDFRNDGGIGIPTEDEVLSDIEFELKFGYYRVGC